MVLAPECRVDFAGMVLFYLLIALPLAIAVTWITISLYRRAVARAMKTGSGERAQTAAAPREVSTELRIAVAPIAAHDNALWRASSAGIRRLTLVYSLAGCAHAAVMTVLFLGFNDLEFLPLRTAGTWLIYAWPVIPAIGLIAIGHRKRKALLVAMYFAALAAINAALTFSGTMDGAFGQYLLFWTLEMGPPTLVLLALSNRAWRGIGLIALTFACVIVFTWGGSFQILGCAVLTTRSSLLLDWIFVLQALIVLAMFGFAWWLLRVMVRRYQRKAISDQSLTLDSWWFAITLVELVLLAGGIKQYAPLALLAFVVYKIVVRAGLPRASRGEGKPLLLLRVFGHAKRSERLLDEVGQRWRYVGPINLIAGADLATSYIEPDELLQFWSGKLGQVFIGSLEDLQRRMRNLDLKPDRDGRYRVNEFFCHSDTWQATVQSLVPLSAAVLMDLRGFTRANLGCQFELGLLLANAPLERIRFLIDATTDVSTLRSLLAELWRERGDPDARDPAVTLLNVQEKPRSVVREVFAAAS